ncbi:MAG: flavin reductase family protein [Planctomycetota bacterium]|nr:flavin reductase family protein [Planctomycetota bacterium]
MIQACGVAIEEALRAFPAGNFLVTATSEGRSNGVLAEFVMQGGHTPPTLVMSTRKGQILSPLIRDSRRFAVAIIDRRSRAQVRRFVHSSVDSINPFIGLQIDYTPNDIPVLQDSVAWFECELARHIDIDSDCELYVGNIVAAGINRDGLFEEELEGPSLREELLAIEVEDELHELVAEGH